MKFLSGGQSEEEASLNLNEMNRLEMKRPWTLSFSYGRALQHTCIRTWAGKDENIEKAQNAFITRAKANSEATLGNPIFQIKLLTLIHSTGKYKGSKDASASESLHVKNYTY